MSAVPRFSGAAHAPQQTQSFGAATPVHFEGVPGGPFAGHGMWRGVKDFEHSTLCRAFELDQATFYFDLPSTVRGVGSSRGGHSSASRTIEGYVMMAGRSEPVAVLYVLRDGDVLRDMDPRSAREHLAFGWRR